MAWLFGSTSYSFMCFLLYDLAQFWLLVPDYFPESSLIFTAVSGPVVLWASHCFLIHLHQPVEKLLVLLSFMKYFFGYTLYLNRYCLAKWNICIWVNYKEVGVYWLTVLVDGKSKGTGLASGQPRHSYMTEAQMVAVTGRERERASGNWLSYSNPLSWELTPSHRVRT